MALVKAGRLDLDFYSIHLNLKLIFSFFPNGEKIKFPNWNQGLTRIDVSPGSVPPQNFLWQGLECSWRLECMPLGRVEQALKGGTNKCLHKVTA